jgi:hypothetical protein
MSTREMSMRRTQPSPVDKKPLIDLIEKVKKLRITKNLFSTSTNTRKRSPFDHR